MAKDVPAVSFRSRKVTEAERAFIEEGVVATEPAKLAIVPHPEPEAAPAVQVEPLPPPKQAPAISTATSAPAISSAKGRSVRQVLQRADGREVRKRTIYLPVPLSRSLDVLCAQLQCDISEIAGEALERWIAANHDA